MSSRKWKLYTGLASVLMILLLASCGSTGSSGPDEKTVFGEADAWLEENALEHYSMGPQNKGELTLDQLEMYLGQANPEMINQNQYQSQDAKQDHSNCYDNLTSISKLAPGSFTMRYSSESRPDASGQIACISSPWSWTIENKETEGDTITYTLSWKPSAHSDLISDGYVIYDFSTYFLDGVKVIQLNSSSSKTGLWRIASYGRKLKIEFVKDESSKKWNVGEKTVFVDGTGGD